MPDTASATLLLHDVLTETYGRHRDWFDKHHVTGMECHDPADASPGRHRKNFFNWLCGEYHVVQGQMLWLDLLPEDVPQWVRQVLRYIAKDYTEDTELLVQICW